MYDLVIKGGTVVTSRDSIKTDLAVNNGRICAIGDDLEGTSVIDARDRLIMPGGIDSHTHMSLPVGAISSSDDFYTGTVAAACGGITTIIDFSVGEQERTIPEDIRLRMIEARRSVIDYSFHGEVLGWKLGHEEEFREAVEMGVTSFKFYTSYAASGRRSDSGILYHAFQEIARLGAVAIVHAEDEYLIESILSGMSQKDLAKMENLALARPDICEGAAIDQVAFYAEQTGARIHIVHVSSALGVDRIGFAEERGVLISGETCPQYLLLTRDVYKGTNGHLFSASPVLRETVDQDVLWDALKYGLIGFVVTDHCPFTKEQKTWKGSFLDLPYGLPGVETLIPLLYSEGVEKGRLSVNDLVRVSSENCARNFDLYPRKGNISVGADADLIVFDPERKWIIRADDLNMNTDFSPFEGMEIKGKVEHTLSRGEIIVKNGKFCGHAGRGKFLARELNK